MSAAERTGAGTAQDPASWPAPKTAWFTLSMIGMVTIFGQMDRAIFYLLVSSIKRDLGLSDTQMSLLMGLAYSGAYFLCGLPIARLTDVWRRKIILPTALAVWSFGTTLCALSHTFVQMFVARAFVGSGESVKGPCSVSLISDLFPRERQARAYAAYQFSIRLGESLALILGGLLIGWFATMGPVDVPLIGPMRDWHLVFLVFGAPGLIFALVFVMTVREPVRHGRKVAGSVPIKDVAHFLFKSEARVVLLPILLAAAIGNIEAIGVGSWRPVFYERTYGWTPAEFAPIMGVSTLAIAPLALMAGAWLTERLLRQGKFDANMRLVLWTHIIGLPLAVFAPLMPTFWLALAMSLAASAVGMAAAPAQLAAMQVVTPNELRGQVNALYMLTISVLGQGVGPTAVALITDFVFQSEADLRYAMVFAAVIANPIALVLIWMAVKPYGRAYRQAETVG